MIYRKTIVKNLTLLLVKKLSINIFLKLFINSIIHLNNHKLKESSPNIQTK